MMEECKRLSFLKDILSGCIKTVLFVCIAATMLSVNINCDVVKKMELKICDSQGKEIVTDGSDAVYINQAVSVSLKEDYGLSKYYVYFEKVSDREKFNELKLSFEELKEYKNRNYEELTNGVKVVMPNDDYNNMPMCLYVIGSDENNNIVAVSNYLYIVCDIDKPEIDVLGAKDTKWVNQETEVNIKCRDKGGISRICAYDSDTDDSECIYEWKWDGNESYEENFTVCCDKEASGANGRCVKITVYDMAGNESIYEWSYYLDKSAPTITLPEVCENGTYESDVNLHFAAGDNIPEAALMCLIIIRDYMGEIVTDSKEIPLCDEIDGMDVTLSDDGDYSISYFAKDLAGNESEHFEASFRIDSTQPEIKLLGVENGGVYYEDKVLQILLDDNYYDDANISVTGTRNFQGKSINIPLDNLFSGMNKLSDIVIDKSGDYNFCVSISDNANHTSVANIAFSVIKDKSEVVIRGVENGDIISGNADIKMEFNSLYYDKCKVKVDIYKNNEHTQERVLEDSFEYLPKQSLENIDYSWGKDGSYVVLAQILPINSTDSIYFATSQAEKRTIDSKCFKIDNCAPSIGFLDELDMKYFKKVDIPNNLESYVSDDTKVSIKTYLNSEEFKNGMCVDKEGRYVLYVEAVDEAGNEAVKSCEFIIDNTPPTIVISGMDESNRIKNDQMVSVFLNDEQDYLSKVTVSGKDVPLLDDGKMAKFYIPSSDVMDLKISACDNAGNITNKVIKLNSDDRFKDNDEIIKESKTIALKGSVSDEQSEGNVPNILGTFFVLSGTLSLILRRVRLVDTR